MGLEVLVLAALGEAFLQNLRNALQRALSDRVSLAGAAYARFVFAAPWALGLGLALGVAHGFPTPTPAFVGWALLGALCQIGATLILLQLFHLRNFAVGNTFAKTETVQAALFGLVLLRDRIGLAAMIGTLVSFVGILLISATRGLVGGVRNRAAALGLACGAAFAVSGVAYRGAALALDGPLGAIDRAALTLAFVTVVQTMLMTWWLERRPRDVVRRVLQEWRIAAPVGLAGMLASLLWFTAFALTSAAEVKAVGQVELLLIWFTAGHVFRERPSLRETTGLVLVALGVTVLVLSSRVGPVGTGGERYLYVSSRACSSRSALCNAL